MVQKLVFDRSELEARPVQSRLSRGEVHLEILRDERGRTRRGCRHVQAPQHSLHAGEELEVIERFGDVVVRAELEPFALSIAPDALSQSAGAAFAADGWPFRAC